MSYPNKEGPQTHTIPETTYTTCSGCKYHEKSLFRSGNNPIWQHNCTHESAPKMNFCNNLSDFDGIAEPGNWCPFLRPKPYVDTTETEM